MGAYIPYPGDSTWNMPTCYNRTASGARETLILNTLYVYLHAKDCVLFSFSFCKSLFTYGWHIFCLFVRPADSIEAKYYYKAKQKAKEKEEGDNDEDENDKEKKKDSKKAETESKDSNSKPDKAKPAKSEKSEDSKTDAAKKSNSDSSKKQPEKTGMMFSFFLLHWHISSWETVGKR